MKVNEIRKTYIEKVRDLFVDAGEEVLTVGANQIAMPVVDSEGNEGFVVITVKVPKGSRNGEAYDGYGVAQEYDMKQAERAEKAAEKRKRKNDAEGEDA